MREIVFVEPPYERIAPDYDFVRHVTNDPPSLGLHVAGLRVQKTESRH